MSFNFGLKLNVSILTPLYLLISTMNRVSQGEAAHY